MGVIQVQDKSVVTSGIYERYFIQNNQLYHHIINPATGYPLDNELESITVISDNSLTGDIYSTILYGLGSQKGLEELNRRRHIGAIFVTKNKNIILKSNQHFQFTLLDNSYQLSSKN